MAPWTGDQLVAKLCLYRRRQTQNKRREIFTPRLGFEAKIPMFGRAKMFRALDRSATVVSCCGFHSVELHDNWRIINWKKCESKRSWPDLVYCPGICSEDLSKATETLTQVGRFWNRGRSMQSRFATLSNATYVFFFFCKTWNRITPTGIQSSVRSELKPQAGAKIQVYWPQQWQ
jgi:hypothetical protein